MGELPIQRLGLAVFSFAAGAFALAVAGLALFRRAYARRLFALGVTTDVDLAIGAPWLLALKTAWLALAHPSTTRWGLLYLAYRVFGVDPLAALTDAELRRLARDLSAVRRALGRGPRA